MFGSARATNTVERPNSRRLFIASRGDTKAHERLGGTIQLSATDVANLSVCPRLVTLELNALGGNGIRPNVYGPVVMRLIQLGEGHERSYLAKLKLTGKSFEELTGRMTQEEGTARTLDAMKCGVDIIYQGFLRGPGWFGRTDFLVRVNIPSRLGSYSYEVVDTKLSLEAKARALIQLCLYSQLLEDARDCSPNRCTSFSATARSNDSPRAATSLTFAASLAT